MKLSSTFVAALVALVAGTCHAFTSAPHPRPNVVFGMTTMAESGVPPATSESTETKEADIPTNLPSEKNMDYIPLATMLATGQLAEADQVSSK